MKIVVMGGVASSQVAVEKLHEHGFRDVTVYGFRPSSVANVSSFRDLEIPAVSLGYRFRPFARVNDCASEINEAAPDLIFVVGLSQLVSTEILDIPKLGCVGFHPTALPRGRGRAPIAWLTLRCEDGAATFFRLREGADDGEIFVQEPFQVIPGDSASTVEQKILNAERTALDRWLPTLVTGLAGQEQAHERATYYGVRKPEDGVVNWLHSAASIDRLIKAAGRPHPGAFTYHDDCLIRIWRSRAESDSRFLGVPGRILTVAEDHSFLIQCGEACLWIDEWMGPDSWTPLVGMRFGYCADVEINRLRNICFELAARVEDLEARLNGQRTLPGEQN
jgi:methionyl-tRNA formyltransferase